MVDLGLLAASAAVVKCFFIHLVTLRIQFGLSRGSPNPQKTRGEISALNLFTIKRVGSLICFTNGSK